MNLLGPIFVMGSAYYGYVVLAIMTKHIRDSHGVFWQRGLATTYICISWEAGVFLY